MLNKCGIGPSLRVDVSVERGRSLNWLCIRESMEHLLTGRPQSLQVMLDALQEALQMESDAAELVSEPSEEREEEACTLSLKP